jgi:hypothetical protein
MEKQNKSSEQSGVYEDGSVDTDLRIRQSQHATLSRKFVKVWGGLGLRSWSEPACPHAVATCGGGGHR